jgi:hypothetical protein
MCFATAQFEVEGEIYRQQSQDHNHKDEVDDNINYKHLLIILFHDKKG